MEARQKAVEARQKAVKGSEQSQKRGSTQAGHQIRDQGQWKGSGRSVVAHQKAVEGSEHSATKSEIKGSGRQLCGRRHAVVVPAPTGSPSYAK